MGGGWNAGGLRHCGAAQIVEGTSGRGDFRNQSRRESGRKCLLLRDGRRSAGSGDSSCTRAGDVPLFQENRQGFWARGATGAAVDGTDAEGRFTTAGSAERERAGSVEWQG